MPRQRRAAAWARSRTPPRSWVEDVDAVAVGADEQFARQVTGESSTVDADVGPHEVGQPGAAIRVEAQGVEQLVAGAIRTAVAMRWVARSA